MIAVSSDYKMGHYLPGQRNHRVGHGCPFGSPERPSELLGPGRRGAERRHAPHLDRKANAGTVLHGIRAAAPRVGIKLREALSTHACGSPCCVTEATAQRDALGPCSHCTACGLTRAPAAPHCWLPPAQCPRPLRGPAAWPQQALAQAVLPLLQACGQHGSVLTGAGLSPGPPSDCSPCTKGLIAKLHASCAPLDPHRAHPKPKVGRCCAVVPRTAEAAYTRS